jgi:hypothetical protein
VAINLLVREKDPMTGKMGTCQVRSWVGRVGVGCAEQFVLTGLGQILASHIASVSLSVKWY